jgi:hypothetical protein
MLPRTTVLTSQERMPPMLANDLDDLVLIAGIVRLATDLGLSLEIQKRPVFVPANSMVSAAPRKFSAGELVLVQVSRRFAQQEGLVSPAADERGTAPNLCPGCGRDVGDTAPLCPYCLKPLASIQTEPRPPSRGSSWKDRTLFVLNLIILFGFLFAVAALTS